MQDKSIIDMYTEDLATWKRWKRKKNMSNSKLLHTIITYGTNKVLFDNFMRSLTSRDDYKKSLSHCRIDKSKVTIEKRGAS
jgi:hypothetical protein